MKRVLKVSSIFLIIFYLFLLFLGTTHILNNNHNFECPFKNYVGKSICYLDLTNYIKEFKSIFNVSKIVEIQIFILFISIVLTLKKEKTFLLKREKPRFNIIQMIFSKGILNPKAP